jgi:hypothetical protein
MDDKIKIYIFSDESGSWHDDCSVYVRSWVAISEKAYEKMINKIDEISSMIGSKELSWKTIAGNKKYFGDFNDLFFRVFITVSSPKDIDWCNKYVITRNFDASLLGFDFGELDSKLQIHIKDKILKDIKNVLFLNFYEKHHIKNAQKGIEKVIKRSDYELVYRVDPPQMSQDGWRDVLNSINDNDINLEFPRSERTQGIQFADIIAGCFRSLLEKDYNYEHAINFYRQIKDKIIRGDSNISNPNLIFFGEINQELKSRCKDIWNL